MMLNQEPKISTSDEFAGEKGVLLLVGVLNLLIAFLLIPHSLFSRVISANAFSLTSTFLALLVTGVFSYISVVSSRFASLFLFASITSLGASVISISPYLLFGLALAGVMGGPSIGFLLFSLVFLVVFVGIIIFFLRALWKVGNKLHTSFVVRTLVLVLVSLVILGLETYFWSVQQRRVNLQVSIDPSAKVISDYSQVISGSVSGDADFCAVVVDSAEPFDEKDPQYSHHYLWRGCTSASEITRSDGKWRIIVQEGYTKSRGSSEKEYRLVIVNMALHSLVTQLPVRFDLK